MKTLSMISLALPCIVYSISVSGYKEETHARISTFAAIQSALARDPNLLPRLGLDPWGTNQKFPNNVGDLRDIRGLFQFGATFEDSGTRALNHFYDPLSSQPLTIAGVSLPNHTSPDWALEDTAEINGTAGVGGQDFSYRDARTYFYQALTDTTEAERGNYFGLMFQTLGQVIHHIQDMAQPQHVRNDAHLDQGGVEIFGLQLNPLYNPRLYESYTNGVRNTLPYVGTQSTPL